MSNGNVIVEDLGNGNARETAFNAPAIETVNARLEQVGPFRQDNPGAAQAATALTLMATDASAPIEIIASRAGTIVGVVARSNADLSAGTATFTASIAGALVGTAAVLSDLVQQAISEFAPVDFVAGARLGIKLATSAGYLPITADQSAWLMIRWGV
jgi:hypothetical protein